jgi:hypothetical protein
MANNPKPRIAVPIIGTIQCTFSSAVQPYRNRAIGTAKAPRNTASSQSQYSLIKKFLDLSWRYTKFTVLFVVSN